MDTIECITNRRSIRAFQDKPVPEELLTKMIETACLSPSYKNSQPWQVMVVSGASRCALWKADNKRGAPLSLRPAQNKCLLAPGQGHTMPLFVGA